MFQKPYKMGSEEFKESVPHEASTAPVQIKIIYGAYSISTKAKSENTVTVLHLTTSTSIELEINPLCSAQLCLYLLCCVSLHTTKLCPEPSHQYYMEISSNASKQTQKEQITWAALTAHYRSVLRIIWLHSSVFVSISICKLQYYKQPQCIIMPP